MNATHLQNFDRIIKSGLNDAKSQQFSDVSLTVFLLLSLVGATTNVMSLIYIERTFPVRKRTIFLLVFADAFISATCCIICMVDVGVLFTGKGWTVCSVLFLSIYFPCMMGPFLTSAVAVIRYKSLLSTEASSANGSSNDNVTRWVIVLLSTGIVTFVICFVGLHVNYDAPFSMVTDICLRGDLSVPLPPYTSISSLAPCIVFTTISLVVDAIIVRTIKDSVAPFAKFESGTVMFKPAETTIPVRATVLSALSLLPYLGIGALLSGLSKVLSSTLSGTLLVCLALLINAARCPLTALITFKVRRHELQVSEITQRWTLRWQRRDSMDDEISRLEQRFRRDMARARQEARSTVAEPSETP